MSVAALPLEFDRIRQRTKSAMGWSAIAHVFFMLFLAHVLGQQQAKVDDAVEVTWLDPAKAKPAPPAAVAAPAPAAAEPKPEPPKPAAAPAKPAPAQPVTPPADRGTVGRARAKEATKELAAATASIDGVLKGLDDALETSTDATATTTRRGPRRNAIRGGRAASAVGASSSLPVAGVGGDGSSAIDGARIEIGAIGGVQGGSGDASFGTSDGMTGGRSGVQSGGARSDLRSDASLLAVVRKYAPGIRFCYENELKKKPGLGGKLVVAITVAAAGNMTEAVIVQDTLGSAALTQCAIAQIVAWRFPAIERGVVTFRAPFVFTPPE